MTKADVQMIASAITGSFIHDEDGENENVVDALGKIATQLKYLGNGNAGTDMGAIEAHGVAVKESGNSIGEGLESVATAIRYLADTIADCHNSK